jgi:hypothetical protein
MSNPMLKPSKMAENNESAIVNTIRYQYLRKLGYTILDSSLMGSCGVRRPTARHCFRRLWNRVSITGFTEATK